MSLTLKIETDNAAFEDPYELGRIIRGIAYELDNGNTDIDIRDVNGNRCGSFAVD